MTRKPTVAIVGAGSLATFLAPELNDAGFTITEIIARDSPRSRRHARALAAKVGARTVTAHSASLDATLLWFCVPDREIRGAASALAGNLAARAAAHTKNRVPSKAPSKVRFAFHSSGALLSRELEPLRKAGIAVASVHPLMTFVAGTHPSLTGVPFAMEGDAAATRVARQIVRKLGGESFPLARGAQSGVPRMGHSDIAAAAGVPGDARRSGSCRRLHAQGRSSQEPPHHQADFGKLLAPRSGAVF